MTPKQEEFVRQYLIDRNATQAAIRAGYSEKTAHVQGPRLLANVSVAAAIRKATEKHSERVELKADDVIRGLLQEAKAGDPDQPHPARIRAWELLGKHIGMFIERHQHTVKPLHQMTDDELRFLAGIENDNDADALRH